MATKTIEVKAIYSEVEIENPTQFEKLLNLGDIVNLIHQFDEKISDVEEENIKLKKKIEELEEALEDKENQHIRERMGA